MSGLVTLATVLDPSALQAKQEQLFAILRSMGRVLVAYSGGTDSAYLAWAAHQALGDHAIAVTADSPSVPRSHMREAIEFARQFGIRHEIVETREFENPAYSANNPDRCFHCKDELFRRMEEIAPAFELRLAAGQAIVYGVNTDDLGDYRPGQKAAQSHAVKAPLVEAGLSKAEIRELSRLAGLPTWDRPAALWCERSRARISRRRCGSRKPRPGTRLKPTGTICCGWRRRRVSVWSATASSRQPSRRSVMNAGWHGSAWCSPIPRTAAAVSRAG